MQLAQLVTQDMNIGIFSNIIMSIHGCEFLLDTSKALFTTFDPVINSTYALKALFCRAC